MTPQIIFQDEDILVVNKPVGLIVNNSQTSGDITVQNIFSSSIDIDESFDEDADPQSDFQARGGIVHRIDKDTSGVLLIAKNESAFIDLQKQFKSRTVEKEYLALVVGEVRDSQFEIDAPIKRNPRNRFKFAVVADGKEAQTKFIKEQVFNLEEGKVTMLKSYPKTGRTHQIRVHLAALDHPVVMDPIYSTKTQIEQRQHRFNRLMLHARSITFSHPATKEQMTFEAPIPPEFMIY